MTQTAQQIYNDLIKRIKTKIQKENTRVVYDPETGEQRTYLDGKLFAIRQVQTPKIAYKPSKGNDQMAGNKATPE